MLFKKEFDIDKEFFTEKKQPEKKRNFALKVFLFVFVVTFALLLYTAFSLNFKLGQINNLEGEDNLKEAQSMYFDAIKYYEEGKFERALEELNKQLKIVEDPDAYNYLGKIYRELRDEEKAIENYKHALDLKPDFFEPNFNLGKIYFANNDFKTASYYLTRALKIRDDDVELLLLAAETYKMTGRADDAILLYKNALKLEENDATPNIKIGEIFLQRLQYENAIPYFKNALSVNFSEDAALSLAKCYFELNDFDNASNILKDIFVFNKENKQAQSLKRAIEYKVSQINQINKENELEKQKQEYAPLNKEAVNLYIKEIETPIKTNWAPPINSNLKKVTLKFSINKKGELLSNQVQVSSGSAEFDKSALDAIKLSAPFPPLPASLNRQTLDIIFTFDFNIKN